MEYRTDGKRRVWCKLHIAVDMSTHEIVAVDDVKDAEVFPYLLRQTLRKIIEVSGDGAYDTRNYYDAIRIKRAVPLNPPREGTRTSSQLSGRLPEALRFQQEVEKAVWLS